jgi:cofilin
VDFQSAIIGTKEPRFGILDFAFETDDGRPQDKLCFVFWSPDNGPIKKKMLYASSKDAIKKKLTGIHAEMQRNDASDMEKSEFVSACKR